MSNRQYFNFEVSKTVQDSLRGYAEKQGYRFDTDKEGTLYVNTPEDTYIYRLEPSEVAE